MTQIQIDYDDQGFDVINKINEALHERAVDDEETHCLQFVDDDQDHDAFVVLNLKCLPVLDPDVPWSY